MERYSWVGNRLTQVRMKGLLLNWHAHVCQFMFFKADYVMFETDTMVLRLCSEFPKSMKH